MSDLHALLTQVKQCQLCADHLPLGPNPVVQAHPDARILIIGQAPGTKVHATGIPWNDPSGNRLRTWLDMDKTQFYDPQQIAIMPMGFCYPGKGKSGDLPPRPECAPHWHEQILTHLPNIKLTLLIGQYAQNYYLGSLAGTEHYKTLTDRVKHFAEYPAHLFPLPHPSPRNQIWLKRNSWFEQRCVPELKQRVRQALA